MDESDRRILISLVRERSLAALGTIVEGGPLVSMVLYASEPDRASRNPLTLARVSIQGLAGPLQAGSPAFENARSLYLAVHPTAAINFDLPDFLLLGVHPESARFIAGFGKIFDLDREAWARLKTIRLIKTGGDAKALRDQLQNSAAEKAEAANAITPRTVS